MDLFVFAVAGFCALAGAVGVIASRNPVHSALALVGTLFSIAVLFVAQEANFLAAVQVIVYAGAIVVLFLFVIMLLGVDRAENLTVEPIGKAHRPAALVLALAVLALPILALVSTEYEATGQRAVEGAANQLGAAGTDLNKLGESLFTDYLFAFEVTSVLLVIAVVGAVVLARKVKRAELIADPLVAAAAAEAEERAARRAEAASSVP
ncbi:MAG: NADH-quinone oxidoreductase subunit J, partial [Acidimicrobiales bacterium]|nr:NADH-quinone oxidoreductase subunit J [Acidimicrobiales bacterium]